MRRSQHDDRAAATELGYVFTFLLGVVLLWALYSSKTVLACRPIRVCVTSWMILCVGVFTVIFMLPILVKLRAGLLTFFVIGKSVLACY